MSHGRVLTLSLYYRWRLISDKSQRATTEQVLDPRTLLILQKMLQRQLLKEIHGCISTGKEANVYHAITESGDHRAIKGKVLNQQIFMALQNLVKWDAPFFDGHIVQISRGRV